MFSSQDVRRRKNQCCADINGSNVCGCGQEWAVLVRNPLGVGLVPPQSQPPIGRELLLAFACCFPPVHFEKDGDDDDVRVFTAK